ncbi:uncharacterized protein LOC105019388 isoform X1 [Esox lucius]|uniref:OTU deubiquitinase with linear linkage specificity a n=1 Tax=Esox lucius TaxID=8010 RepID=A0A3P8XQ93_ESOLU|nr:uncharacterized protein LOC105019388 isoform X1 [Esox lucius]XP_010883844.2 uncharacterized protein LOC105019388 isoform X1 [Esox lucius]XP_019897585.2 uncharacterized protein LOC105019388 isoform X1 [Esox lucius]
MGNWCCPAVNSCENVEEISGLLPGGVKGPASSSERREDAVVHNGPEAYPEMRKTEVDKREGSKEKEEAVVTTKVRLSASPKDNGKEDTAKSLPTVTNGLLSSSPNTNTGVLANSLLTAPDKCTKKTATLEESPATKRAPVESKRCTSDPPLCPDEVDARAGEEKNEKKDFGVHAKDTFTEVHNKRSDELTVTPDADEECFETSAVKAEVSPEHISSETAVGVSTISLHNTANLLSKSEEGCSVAVVVASVPDTQLAEACDSHVAVQEKCLKSSATTDTVPHLRVSSNFVMKDGDDGKNMSSDAYIDNSLNDFGPEDPEQSPAVREAITPTQKSLVTETEPTSHTDACKSLNSCKDEKRAGQGGLTDVPCLGDLLEEDEEEVPMQDEKKDKGEMEDCAPVTVALLTETEGEEGQKGQDHKLITVADVKVDVLQVRKEDLLVEEDLGVSEEDLYLGAKELLQGSAKHAGPEPLFEITLPKVEDRCSLDPMVDIRSYGEREWKGSTAKSALIRKGYTELSQRFGCLRRVRGDNYCALRATLFQVLSTSSQPPAWLKEEPIFTWLEDLEEQLGEWTFPSGCRQGEGSEDSVQQLKRYVKLLRNRWEEAVGCSGAEERQRLCEHVFRGGEEELGMLEALKVLMLARASELHAAMQGGGDVPVFCWLLFARDSSDRPRAFLSNHLSKVGFSGGLEQVEMFLLGYTLRYTIRVYRLYMTDTEEFVTYYPDDHKEDWPSVCLVTEDDRHYNVPVGQLDGLQATEVPTGASQDLTADRLDS